MGIPIPIPYGRQYSVEMKGSMMKSCHCASCGADYFYEVVRSATGTGMSFLWLNNKGAAQNAESAARQQLEAQLKAAIDPVHCPTCGWLQADMVAQLKNARF